MHLRGTIAATLRLGLGLGPVLGGLSACQEPPSYRLRWSIEGRGAPTVAACSDSGMFEVRARALVDGRIVDELALPCASEALADDPDALVDGTVLPPGEYELQLRGFDRGGEPWQTEEVGSTPDQTRCIDGASACPATELVCDCTSLIVREEETTDLPELVLVPPPECRDGIDNDGDGVVDDRDPSCRVDAGTPAEGIPVGLTELRLELTLLAHNPNATCSSVTLRRIRVELLPEGEGSEVTVLEDICRIDRPYLLSLRIPEGPYTFLVTGLDSAGAAVTRAKTFDATIDAAGGSILESIDFAPEDFLEPIVRHFSVAPQYVSALGLDEGGASVAARGSCSADSTPGTLELTDLQMTLLDAHGGPLPEPAFIGGIPLDGSERECESVFLTDEALTWGGYVLEINALSAEGEVCFSNAEQPEPMRPSDLLGVYLPRVYDAGQVPVSCRECEVDDDCDPDEPNWACLEGVCQRPCELDRDCESPVLGDLDFVCMAVDGYEARYCRHP